MNDQQIEQEIQAKGLIAPRVTPADIEANIVSEHYFTAAGARDGEDAISIGPERVSDRTIEVLSLLTFCVLVLRNGFTVPGESYCADAERFDAETGRNEARKDAINKAWQLMVYALKERLAGQA